MNTIYANWQNIKRKGNHEEVKATPLVVDLGDCIDRSQLKLTTDHYGVDLMILDAKQVFVEHSLVSAIILMQLSLMMTEVYDLVEGQTRNWNIRLHPYRIIANDVEPGEPTQEGLHRNGVTYIASLMIDKVNISGDETTITYNNGDILESLTWRIQIWSTSFDLVLANDEKTMHKVTGINPNNIDKFTYRDVLVIAFTKMED